MLDNMSMPVLFALLITALAVISIGGFLVFRVIGGINKGGDEAPAEPAAGRRRRTGKR